jgi:hypothetical protein
MIHGREGPKHARAVEHAFQASSRLSACRMHAYRGVVEGAGGTEVHQVLEGGIDASLVGLVGEARQPAAMQQRGADAVHHLGHRLTWRAQDISLAHTRTQTYAALICMTTSSSC